MKTKLWGILSALFIGLSCGGSGGGSGGPSGAVSPSSSVPPPTGLASLGFIDCNLELCHRRDTPWSIAKSGTLSGSAVVWTVTVTRGAAGTDEIVVDGFVRVRNYCPWPATIGNVVIDLQRNIGGSWKTVVSDVATASQGDAATIAYVAPGAAWEWWRTSFAASSGSLKLEVMDGSFNSLFACSPRPQVGPNADMDLLFSARFDNSVLGIPAGEWIYAEAVFSFGNAEPAGVGAFGSGIDIDGDGTISPDEKNVATLAGNFCRQIPPLETCNGTVRLADGPADIAASAGVGYSGFWTDIGGGSGVETVSTSIVRSVGVTLNAGSNGTIANGAHLMGTDSWLSVTVTLSPPPSYLFPCCVAARECAGSAVTAGSSTAMKNGDYTTYTQGGWGSPPSGSNPGQLLASNFAALYPSGLVIGIPDPGKFWMRFSSAAAVQAYLPAGGPPGALTGNLVNPRRTSAGVFGGQVLALRLNVDMSAAGVTSAGFGSLKLTGTGSSLDGQSVASILAAAQQALGGGALPAGFTISTLNDLVTSLNESFNNSATGPWALAHLVK